MNFYKHNDENIICKYPMFVIVYKSINYYKNALTMHKNESRIQSYQTGNQ